MWLLALGYVVAANVLTTILILLFGEAGNLLGLAAQMALPGMFANALYYRHCTRMMAAAEASGGDLQSQLVTLAGKGGTGKGAMVLIVLLFGIVIVGMLAAIAIPQYQMYTNRARLSEAAALGRQGRGVGGRVSAGPRPVSGDTRSRGLCAERAAFCLRHRNGRPGGGRDHPAGRRFSERRQPDLGRLRGCIWQDHLEMHRAPDSRIDVADRLSLTYEGRRRDGRQSSTGEAGMAMTIGSAGRPTWWRWRPAAGEMAVWFGIPDRRGGLSFQVGGDGGADRRRCLVGHAAVCLSDAGHGQHAPRGGGATLSAQSARGRLGAAEGGSGSTAEIAGGPGQFLAAGSSFADFVR